MILASQSPRRIELLRETGFEFRVIPADVNEKPLSHEDPFFLVERLACMKAATVLAAHAEPSEIVLAADTIVTIDGEVLGKPSDATDARAMLRRLSGRTHTVATGVCIARCDEREPRRLSDDELPISFVAKTDVTFYKLSDEEIDAYIDSGEPMDKAGAYGIQGTGGRMLVKGIEGDFYNVVGLPIAEVIRKLKAL
ncbi:Maf family protein [Enorma sp.]|uniref:Maf family protein n=1 Tax=Enorma sp. TaxID=1920692 RepID=UPI0025C19C74|nr:Maf family protein [Enorma sp.]